ncbi:ABC transporter ATP-binding protein [Ornithinibacillus massiliensis]|uniref:ABC transporter ATP-binding protein n=1 Tax=Ornithinibacillus massiliensis TaxID=1944633 RepID=A0ABS5M8Q2_9BACI|nr:ABC transporter ATP-binding protein [Ornithinibacillus massiliensis]MBS3678694.1 ABC transporter ATP-binding protein [Ornithinibacillus massiliensis]
MSIVLSASRISKTFSNELEVIKPTSFEIEKGKIYVIEGKSGSGKSTFLSMLAGIEEPTLGKVFYRDRSLYDLNDNEQARIRGESFGFVFQSFHLIPELSVKENIELPLMFNQKDNIFKTQYLAERLEIEYLLEKKPHQLSGGEQQRVAIARALITLPEIIFADEPTGNLDYATTRKVVDLLCQLCSDYRLSLVIVTHEKNLIENPHHLYTMQNGELKVERTNV